ncbi:MATE efflux family protein [Ramicandelaber brevisporus]|nr:MATE efflux family protein [Ramicandelaber brevisporus]
MQSVDHSGARAHEPLAADEESSPLLSPTAAPQELPAPAPALPPPHQPSSPTLTLNGDGTASSSSSPSRPITSTSSTVWTEALTLLQLIAPIAIGSAIFNVTGVAETVAVGRLGTLELASQGMAGLVVGITALAPFMGAITALDTLCSQAVGGGESTKKMAGVYLQRALVIVWMMCIPLSLIWWNIGLFLKNFGVDDAMIPLIVLYLRGFIPSILIVVTSECIKKFLYAQGLMRFSTYVVAITSPVQVGLLFLLTFHPAFNLGFVGLPVAYFITQSIVLALYVYMIVYIDGHQCWVPWSTECFRHWEQIFRLALPGVVLVYSILGTSYVTMLGAATIGREAIAAQNAAAGIQAIFSMLSLSIGTGTATRVGNLLGANNAALAKLSFSISVTLAALLGVFNCSALIIFRHSWSTLFSSDPAIIEGVASAIIPIAIAQLGSAVAAGCSGTLRGQGRQRITAGIRMVTSYLIAIPSGFIFALKFKLGITGLWFGVALGELSSAIIELYYVSRTNWEHEAKKAQERLVSRAAHMGIRYETSSGGSDSEDLISSTASASEDDDDVEARVQT